jgi:hypothetical protein
MAFGSYPRWLYRELSLQFALTKIHFVGPTPSGIFELSQEQSGAHLGIIACSVMVGARYVEVVA